MTPSGWVETTLDALGPRDRPAIKAGPFGSALKKSFYVESGYKVYGQEQVIAGDLRIGDYYIDGDRFETLKACAVHPGDVLVSLVGTFGKSVVVTEQAEAGINNPRLIRISLDQSVIDWNRYQECLERAYAVFWRDFGTERPTFRGKRMALKRHPLLDGKCATSGTS